MAQNIKIDAPAFPETRWDDKTRQEVQWCGMTLRDWFAGQALVSVATAVIATGGSDGRDMPPKLLAETAYSDRKSVV